MTGFARVLTGASLISALSAVALPALAYAPPPNDPNHYRGAPGPIAGAGLPVLAVGYGIYWLTKRRRKTD
jgi:hypothetical protein